MFWPRAGAGDWLASPSPKHTHLHLDYDTSRRTHNTGSLWFTAGVCAITQNRYKISENHGVPSHFYGRKFMRYSAILHIVVSSR